MRRCFFIVSFTVVVAVCVMLVISLVMRRNQQEAIRVERENNARLETVNTDMKKTKRIVRDRWKMKGKRVIAGILLAGILAVTLSGCKNTDNTKEEPEKPVITLGSDNYPPYNYLNEDGVPTGIDVELATEAFERMGYQVKVVQINWEKKKELVESGEIDCIMGCFSMEGRLDDYR